MTDLLLHAVGGGLFVVACQPWGVLGVAGATAFSFIFGLRRETRQGTMNPHKWREALAWPVGAALTGLGLWVL